MPTGKIGFGITELSEYNQFNISNKLLANHDLLTFETGTLTTGLKFDNLKDITNGKRSINGSFEYVQDFSSDINYEFLNSGDTVYQTKTYSGNSIHNLKSSFFKFKLLNLSTLQSTYVNNMSDNFILSIKFVIKVKILFPMKVIASSSSLPPIPLYLLPKIKSLFFDNLIKSSIYFGSKE